MVGAGVCSWSLRSWALSTMRIAMTIASAPSTPAAHSRARWPDENVPRAGPAEGDGCRWPGAAGQRSPGPAGQIAAARAWAADGTAAGVARPIDGAWIRPRWPPARAHRGNGVGEQAARAVPHTRVLDQRDLDQLAHIGRQVGGQRRRRFLDVLHRHGQRAVAGEGPLTRKRFVANDSQCSTRRWRRSRHGRAPVRERCTGRCPSPCRSGSPGRRRRLWRCRSR